MESKKRILLKITGEVFLDKEHRQLSSSVLNTLITQIKKLSGTHQFGIVVGGGNFFRGNQHGKVLGLSPSVGHQIGMLATMMNGLILKDILEHHELATSLFCAMPSPEVGEPISQQTILSALNQEHTLVFTGGTGNPFFTTDTNAVLRALQISADEIWKGTSVDGVYDTDPRQNPHAQKLSEVSYAKALQENLGIMDMTAYALADTYKKTVRVFDVFSENCLINAAQNPHFGSRLIS